MICFPNAKINLGLNVVEKRPDGYHNIETVFIPVGIKDALEIVPAPFLNVQYEWYNTGRQIDAPANENICIKALKALQAVYPQIPSIKVHLHKNIPFGAGLGGGSADGAFMLKLLNNSFNLGASNEQLKKIASTLGADCPFFIDNTPNYATGIGDILEPVNIDVPNMYLSVVVPNVHVSTPDAYRNIKPTLPEKSLRLALAEPIENWRHWVVNDFEKPVFAKFPIIKEIKEYMYQQGAVYASMSGSGSSVFGLFNQNPNLNIEGMFSYNGLFLGE